LPGVAPDPVICTAARSRSRWSAAARQLSDRLAAAQRSLCILDAIRWDEDVERAFFAAGARNLPPVTSDYYRRRQLAFEPDHKRQELRDLARAVRHRLGSGHPCGKLLARACRECLAVIDLLVHRGTRNFAVISRRLYAPDEDGGARGPLCRDAWAERLGAALGHSIGPDPEPKARLGAAEVARLLRARLAAYFGEGAVQVRVAEGLTADAAARGVTLKLRRGALLSPCAVRLLEVHEGWVHLGTTLNARCQPVCTFLAHSLPSAASTQEGLAVLTELLSGASYPARLRRLDHRVRAVAVATAGGDFRDVYRLGLSEGFAPREAYQHAVRVFRGSLPAGCGPFAKDSCYLQGCLLVAGFLFPEMSSGAAAHGRLLFCGKTRLGDAAELAQLNDEGVLKPPRYVPPPFAAPQASVQRLRALLATGSSAVI
jgi:uncharacterized protein (TIGR02421 family)